MTSFSYVLTDKDGIHARPAGLLVKAASVFSSNITIKKGEKSGDGKRIFSVMGLAAKCGDEIVIECDGSDEAEAKEAIETFLKENL